MMEDARLIKEVAREMQTGVVVFDLSGTVLYANPFFLKCFSLDGEVKGANISTFASGSDFFRAVEGFLAGDKNQSRENHEIEINEKDRFFNLRMVPVKDASDRNFIVFLQDITEEKKLEAIKRDFVANVSHELRTPLSSIKGYAETLLDGGMEDKKTLKEFLRIIDKHAGRMSRLIEDLLILSRLESHQMTMTLEPVDIGELIRSITEGFRKQAKDKRIKLTLHLKMDAPKVSADRVRLEQVMVNLLDNAIKYTPQGGTIEVVAKGAGGAVRVDVKDTGIGIPPHDIPRIFERFYRVDKGRSRELGGTGLGLAIVKHIIQGLNGKVWVESAPGVGSTFSFTLKSAI